MWFPRITLQWYADNYASKTMTTQNMSPKQNVDTNDNLQQKICGTCTSEISHWHNFIQTCLESQNKLNHVPDMDCNKRNSKRKIADISCSNTSPETTPEEKQISCNIKHELIVPDKVVDKASDFKNVACLSDAEFFVKTRSKISTSLVTNTHLNNNNKRPVNAASSINRLCSESKAGGTYCIARWCGNNAKKNPGISLFRIPKDLDRALLWLTNAEREDLKIHSVQTLHTKYLCMDHFTDNMFMNSNKKKLVWNALPTNFPKPNYVRRKESQLNSRQKQGSDISEATRQVLLSNVQQPIRRRPLKPKPLIVKPNAVTEEMKRVSLTASAISSLTNNSQCIKKEGSTMTEIRTNTLKMQRNDRSLLPKCQINTSQMSLQANRTFAIPGKNKLAIKCQESTGHTRTANIIVCSNLNEIIDLKQDKIQTVTSTCEYISPRTADFIHREDNCTDLPTVVDNRRSTGTGNDTLMAEESYLNCDVESLCLEHAFRETNERIYPCRYCGEMFLVKSNLILHQTTYHSDHPVGCELCGKVLYKSRSEFMEHVCDHHNDNIHK